MLHARAWFDRQCTKSRVCSYTQLSNASTFPKGRVSWSSKRCSSVIRWITQYQTPTIFYKYILDKPFWSVFLIAIIVHTVRTVRVAPFKYHRTWLHLEGTSRRDCSISCYNRLSLSADLHSLTTGNHEAPLGLWPSWCRLRFLCKIPLR